MKTFSLLLTLLASTFFISAQEKQIAFEPTGKIWIIDEVLAAKLDYFTEYPDFKQALLFQENDSVFTLEITSGKQNENFRIRKNLTLADKEMMLSDIGERLKSNSPRSLLNQEGRTELLLINSMISYSFYGMAASAIFSTDDINPAIYLLSAGTGFIAPMLMTRNKDVTKTQAIMTGFGQTRGILHGLLLPLLFSRNPDYRLTLGMGLAGSIGEALIGYNWARRNPVNPGQATTIGLYSDFGMMLGLGTAATMGVFEMSEEKTPGLLALTTLAGAAGGMIYGHNLSKKDYYSQGDAMMTSNLFLTGAYLPLSILSTFDYFDYKLFTAVGTIGAVAGICAGDKLAQHFEFSNRQSMFSTLSMFGGGLLGAGIGYLIEDTQNQDEYSYDFDPALTTILSAVGAVAGLGLSILNYTKDSNRENKDLSLKMMFNPAGLANSRLTANDPTGKNAIPLVMISGRW